MILEPLLPELLWRDDGRGRSWRSQREVLNGVLWILGSGACWQGSPGHFPPYQTCHRRYQGWVRSGVQHEADGGAIGPEGSAGFGPLLANAVILCGDMIEVLESGPWGPGRRGRLLTVRLTKPFQNL